MQKSILNFLIENSKLKFRFALLAVNVGKASLMLAACDVTQTPALGSVLFCCSLKFLISFEQGALHLYFALDPVNYVSGSACSL